MVDHKILILVFSFFKRAQGFTSFFMKAEFDTGQKLRTCAVWVHDFPKMMIFVMQKFLVSPPEKLHVNFEQDDGILAEGQISKKNETIKKFPFMQP